MDTLTRFLLILFYAGSAILIFRKREWLVYLMCLTVVFYDNFSAIFLNISFHNLKFALKPFLFFEFLLIFLCFGELLKKKKFPHSFNVYGKTTFICFIIFASMAAYCTFAMHDKSLVGINLIIMISMIALLPYYYADKKFDLNIALCCLFAGLVLSYLPVLPGIIGPLLFSSPEPDYGSYKIYGLIYVIISFLIIYSYLIARKKSTIIFLSVFLLVCFYMVIITRSRASLLALFFCLPIYLAAFLARVSFLKAHGIKIACLYMIFILAFFSFAFLNGKRAKVEYASVKRLATLGHVVDNNDPVMLQTHNRFQRLILYYLAEERTMAWRETIEFIMVNPLKGYGLIFSPSAFGTHNTLLRVFVSTGILGFLFYISGVIILFIFLLKNICSSLLDDKIRLFYFSLALLITGCGINGLLQTNINEYLPWFIIAVSFVVLENEARKSVSVKAI